MIQQFRKTLAVGFVALAVTMGGTAMAATVTMDFEGVVEKVVPEVNFKLSVTPYTEEGFMLTNNNQSDGIFLPASGVNTNGSAIFGWCSSSPRSCLSPTTITLSKDGGGVFDFLSFDSAILDKTGGTTASLQVIGNRFGGGTMSASIVQDASWNTETLNFLGVTSVDFVFGTGLTDSEHAFDNLMMSTAGTVPEPGSLALLGLALASLGFGRAQRTHHPA